MTENHIKFVNEDGKIVGKNPETGETVPIVVGETIAESVSTNSADVTNEVDAGLVNTGKLNTNFKFVHLDEGSSAVQSAVDEIGAFGGGFVILHGEGTYTWNNSVVIDQDNVELWGPAGGATLTQDSSGTDAEIIAIRGDDNNYVENSAIRFLQCDGARSTNIWVQYARDCEVTNFYAANSQVEFGNGLNFNDCEHCFAGYGVTKKNTDTGVHISSGSKRCTVYNVISYNDSQIGTKSGLDLNNTTQCILRDCWAIDTNGIGLHINGHTQNKIIGGGSIGATGRGLAVRGDNNSVEDISVVNSGTDDNGVYVAPDADYSTLERLYIENAGEWAMKVDANKALIKDIRAIAGPDTNTDLTGLLIAGKAKDVCIKDINVTGYSNAFQSNAERTRVNGLIEIDHSPNELIYDHNDAGTTILNTSLSPPDRYKVGHDGGVFGPL